MSTHKEQLKTQAPLTYSLRLVQKRDRKEEGATKIIKEERSKEEDRQGVEVKRC